MLNRRKLLKLAGLGAFIPLIPISKLKENNTFIWSKDGGTITFHNAFYEHFEITSFCNGIFKPFIYQPKKPHSENNYQANPCFNIPIYNRYHYAPNISTLTNEYYKKLNDDGWRTILSAAMDRKMTQRIPITLALNPPKYKMYEYQRRLRWTSGNREINEMKLIEYPTTVKESNLNMKVTHMFVSPSIFHNEIGKLCDFCIHNGTYIQPVDGFGPNGKYMEYVKLFDEYNTMFSLGYKEFVIFADLSGDDFLAPIPETCLPQIDKILGYGYKENEILSPVDKNNNQYILTAKHGICVKDNRKVLLGLI